jgi:hypothetical protein
MRNFLSNSRVKPAVRGGSGPPAFYREALAAFRVFTDRGGTLVDSPSLVKIVYRSLIATIVTAPKAVGQSPSNRFLVWKRLQGKHLLPLARNLLWQVSHNILPIRSFLKHRHVISEDKCAVCGQEEENLEHRFLDCPINKQTWVTLYRILPILQNFNLTQ